MGCSASQSAVVALSENEETPATNKPIPPPTSFEIRLEDDVENGEAWKEQEEAAEAVDSLIKKHPPLLPKRLEERLTKQLSPPPTISDLSDKLANAELRRNSILRERVNNIRNTLKREGIENEDFIEEEEEPNTTTTTAMERTDGDLPDSEDKSQKNAN